MDLFLVGISAPEPGMASAWKILPRPQIASSGERHDPAPAHEEEPCARLRDGGSLIAPPDAAVDRERLGCGVIRRQEDLELVVQSIRQQTVRGVDEGGRVREVPFGRLDRVRATSCDRISAVVGRIHGAIVRGGVPGVEVIKKIGVTAARVITVHLLGGGGIIRLDHLDPADRS